MNTKTVDERLRERARDQLRRRLMTAQRDFEQAIEILGTTDKITVTTIEGVYPTYNREAIKNIVDQAFKKLAPKYEEKEISNFLKQVDELQDQVDDLYQGIGND